MRNTEEQLHEIMRRAGGLKRKRALKTRMYADIAVFCACAVMLAGTVTIIPRLGDIEGDAPAAQYGSLLIAEPYIGYVIVGLLSFALGICLTLAFYHWGKLKQEEFQSK